MNRDDVAKHEKRATLTRQHYIEDPTTGFTYHFDGTVAGGIKRTTVRPGKSVHFSTPYPSYEQAMGFDYSVEAVRNNPRVIKIEDYNTGDIWTRNGDRWDHISFISGEEDVCIDIILTNKVEDTESNKLEPSEIIKLGGGKDIAVYKYKGNDFCASPPTSKNIYSCSTSDGLTVRFSKPHPSLEEAINYTYSIEKLLENSRVEYFGYHIGERWYRGVDGWTRTEDYSEDVCIDTILLSEDKEKK